MDQIRRLAEPLAGRRVLHLSATAFGGGVAEIQYTLVPLMQDAGLDVEWRILRGAEEFFHATKTIHNALQGNPQGMSDEQREAFGDTVVDTVAEYAPNLKKIILHRQVLTPLDLEREWGLTEGNIFQGELSLEQLFFLRPVPGWARYRTPVRHLYMCGSATHPGGGIMGAPGRLAALEILKDWKRGKLR